MIRLSKGEIHHLVDRETREFTIHHYIDFYRQPFKNYATYKAYHFWDMHFMWWHKSCERVEEAFDKWSHKRTGRENCKHAVEGMAWDKDHNPITVPKMCLRMPYTARQDEKCYLLWRRGRKEIGRIYLQEIPKDQMTDRTVLGPPDRELKGVSDVDSTSE